VTEIKVLSAGAVEGLLAAVVPEFTRTSGIAVSKSFGTVGVVQKRLKAGEQADVIIMSGAAIDALEGEGGALPGSRRDVCRTAVGLAMREGAPLPDISTLEAFKRALLAARSITATDPAAGGSAGIYLVQLLERMGILEEFKQKAKLWGTGRAVIETLAKGEADLGITFISELLLIDGLKVVGPLPKEIGFSMGYTATISADTVAVEPSRAFIAFLTSEATRARFKALGLEVPAAAPYLID